MKPNYKTLRLWLCTAAFTAAVALTGCGAGSSEATSDSSAMGDFFHISPLGNTSYALGTVPTSAGMLASMRRGSDIVAVRIRYMNGQPYRPDFEAYVTISTEGQCLTNPAVRGVQDNGGLVFKPCNDDGGEYGLRQMFMIKRNQNNAYQIVSNIGILLGWSTQQSECLESPSPGVVKRQQCSGLHNWSVY